MEKIDFVIAWVNGNDPEWIREKEKYQALNNRLEDNKDIMEAGNVSSRFRDWDNLQYIFRGIEKFTPWVNRVHFVTCGHLPAWINKNNPKLNIVYHKDFIPTKYLPTFNANTIELNFHRINGLSEHFVYFNDDMFVLAPLCMTDFFRNGLPCQSAIMDISVLNGRETTALHHIFNMGPINRNFNKKETLRKYFFKWINPVYGRLIINNILLSYFDKFTGFMSTHLPNALMKSVYEEIWNAEFETLDRTCMCKFRSIENVNQWLIDNWQMASGRFVPRTPKIGRSYIYSDNTKNIILDIITNQKCKMICINDSERIIDFENARDEVKAAFDRILPDKSMFEI